MTTFKIKGVCIDTTTTTYSYKNLPIDSSVESVLSFHTNPSSNNEFLWEEFIKNYESSPLIVTMDFIQGFDYVLEKHLETFGRNSAQLLLIDSTKIDVLENLSSITEISGEFTTYGFGIKNPESVELLEKIKAEQDFKYISLDLCPLNFNWSIIKWAQENNIDIIGFNPFGGKLSSASVVEAFTAPYLLGFSANYSDVVVLSGRDLHLVPENLRYLASLIGKESTPKYVIKKNVKKLYKPVKKIVCNSIMIDKDLVIPYDYPEMVFPASELEISLGAPSFKIIDENEEGESSVLISYIKSLSLPEEVDDSSKLSIIRYRLEEYLKDKFPKGSIRYCYLGSTFLILNHERPKEIVQQKKDSLLDQVIKYLKKGEEKEESNPVVNFAISVFHGRPIIVQVSDKKA